MGRVRAIARKGSLPHFVHTKVREIAVKGSLRGQMNVSQYVLFTEGLSIVLKRIRGVIFGSIITGSSSEGVAR
jgi:hypothetical protein